MYAPYIRRFPSQNHRIYTVYMFLVNSTSLPHFKVSATNMKTTMSRVSIDEQILRQRTDALLVARHNASWPAGTPFSRTGAI